MPESLADAVTLITGANGQIGRELCRQLRAARIQFLATDLDLSPGENLLRCDLRNKEQIARLFERYRIQVVIHLAAILPTAFRKDPWLGADVNVAGTLELVRQAVSARVHRFVFASSRSVYGIHSTPRPLTEHDPTMPQDPYGAAKCVVESNGEILNATSAIEFVSLRIATVVGHGAQKSSSVWRSQIFEAPTGSEIRIPYSPDALLPLVYVDDVARALVLLAQKSKLGASIYNMPVEICKAGQLKKLVEEFRGSQVELGESGNDGGPLCDGSRFVREFAFQMPSISDRLSGSQSSQA
jgi:nucleoside-diphosphate-sugar epimerase